MTEFLVGVAILIGLIGIVVPVLPGSLVIGGAVLAWAVLNQTTTAWLVFAAVAVLLAAGQATNWVVTARRTRAVGTTNTSLIIGGLAGIVGFFVIPVIGLFIGFPLGLFAAEYVRLRDPHAAWASAKAGLTASGIGILIELTAGLLASGIWLVAVISGV